MSPSDLVERIATAAMDHHPDEREAFLVVACEGDEELLAKVRAELPLASGEQNMTIALGNDDPERIPPSEPVVDQSADQTGRANPDSPIPFVFGKRIAQGGMGAILEADDCKLGRTIAVKVMLQDADMSEADRQRFIQEAAVLGQLEHPNIVPIHDLGRDSEGQLYYTMKMVQGQTLQDILNDLRHEKPEALAHYTLERLLTIFQKVCDALAFAHSRHILHRDLKPENVMVGEFGEVLVMDWGLAKILNGSPDIALTDTMAKAGKSPSGSGSFTDTLQGSVMGTPQYMSPEQAMGLIAELDARSDIFSLGGILYAILTLRPPVKGTTLDEVLQKVANADIASPTGFGKTTKGNAPKVKGLIPKASDIKPLPHLPGGRVPPALSAVVMKALALKKGLRYQKVTSFSEDIGKFQTGFATSAERIGFAGQLMLMVKRNKGIFATAGAAWLLITALVVWFIFNLQTEERETRRQAEIAVMEKESARQALARSAISLAEASFREGNGFAMQEALNDVPEDLRDSTWDYFLARSDSSIAQLDTGSEITDVVAHPRLPSVFVVVDKSGQVTFINVRTGERMRQFSVRPPDLSPAQQRGYRLAITSTGDRVAAGTTGDSSAVGIYDADSGEKLMTCEAGSKYSLEFSPDNSQLLIVVKNGYAAFDTETGKLLWTHDLGTTPSPASFTRDGKRVLVQGFSQGLRLLHAVDGTPDHVFSHRKGPSAAIHPDGNLVVTGDSDGRIMGITPDNNRVVFDYRTDERTIQCIRFTQDGSHFVTVATLSDGRQAIRVWDSATGILVQRLLGGRSTAAYVSFAAVHPLSNEVVVCGPQTRAWSLSRQADYSFSGARKASLAFWGEDEMFAPREGVVAPLLRKHGKSFTLAWRNTAKPYPAGYNLPEVSADGRIAALGIAGPGNVPIHLLKKNGTEVEIFGAVTHSNSTNAIALSPKGKHLACIVGGSRGAIFVLDTVGDPNQRELSREDIHRFGDLAWVGPDRLITLVTAKEARGQSGAEEQVVLREFPTDRILQTITHPSAMDVLAVAPDRTRFAEAGVDKRVRIRDAVTLKVLQEFRAHDGPITALAWHPNNSILATGSADLSIRLWDLETGKMIEEIRGPVGKVLTLDFSPSGNLLGCASGDSVTRIWDLKKGKKKLGAD